LKPGQRCGYERGQTYFGEMSVVYDGAKDQITAHFDGPTRNPPKHIRLRFREPNARVLLSVTVNGKPWLKFQGEWVELPGSIGSVTVQARF